MDTVLRADWPGAPVIFVGDVHRQWHDLAKGMDACGAPPGTLILLGDLECTQPLDTISQPLLARGLAVLWIFGNHDNDGGSEMWANLTDPERNPHTATGALHGRIVDLGGVRIAGLGGTFNPRIWEPPGPRHHRVRGASTRLPDVTAIYPEDYDRLAGQRADILVTHEAPSSHPAGNAALDALARAMGARLIVHGHHHVTYRAISPEGLRAMGVAAGWGIAADGRTLWRGDAPRALGRLPQGWSLEAMPDTS